MLPGVPAQSRPYDTKVFVNNLVKYVLKTITFKCSYSLSPSSSLRAESHTRHSLPLQVCGGVQRLEERPLRTPNLHRSMRAKICLIIGVVTTAQPQVISRPLSTTMSATKLRPKPSRTCGACAATAARMWLRAVCCVVCVIVAVSVTPICGY